MNEGLAFFVAAIATLVCVAENMALDHGLIIAGSTADSLFSLISGPLDLAFPIIMLCFRIPQSKLIKISVAAIGTVSVSAALQRASSQITEFIGSINGWIQSINYTPPVDDVVAASTFTATVCALLVWSARHGKTRTALMLIFAGFVIYGNYTWSLDDPLWRDVMRASEIVVALLLTVGIAPESDEDEETSSDADPRAQSVLG